MNTTNLAFDPNEPLSMRRMLVLLRLMKEARAMAQSAGLRVPDSLALDALRLAEQALRDAGR